MIWWILGGIVYLFVTGVVAAAVNDRRSIGDKNAGLEMIFWPLLFVGGLGITLYQKFNPPPPPRKICKCGWPALSTAAPDAPCVLCEHRKREAALEAESKARREAK